LRGWRFVALVSLSVACFGRTAAAAPPDSTKSPAQRALDLGYEADDLFARGKWDDAYDKFKAADDLAHSPAFVLYMARCRRNAGHLIEAETIYARVAGEPLDADSPKPFRTAVNNATDELADLKKKIPTLRAVANHTTGSVEIKADGKTIAADTPVEMDPGSHDVVATNAGKTSKKTVTIAQGSGETRVTLDFTSPDDPHPSWGHGPKLWGGLALGIGVAAAAGGIVTGAVAWRQHDDVRSRCIGNHCSVKDANEIQEAYKFASISTGLLIFSGVSAVAGGVLLIVRPGRANTIVGVGPASLVVQQSF